MSDFNQIWNVLTDLSKIPNFVKLHLAALELLHANGWGKGNTYFS